eukprot:jgi/Botrbrau1/14369/Bobra.0014s0024.1
MILESHPAVSRCLPQECTVGGTRHDLIVGWCSLCLPDCLQKGARSPISTNRLRAVVGDTSGVLLIKIAHVGTREVAVLLLWKLTSFGLHRAGPAR